MKDKIVERLLGDGSITAAEAIVLLKEYVTPYRKDAPLHSPLYENTGDDDMAPFIITCSCNPDNGGGGICGCTKGSKSVTNSGNWTCDSTEWTSK